MSKPIFSDFGIEIFQRNGQRFVRYDAGEIAVQFQETEISEAECIKAQKSEKDAHEVLLACQRRTNLP